MSDAIPVNRIKGVGEKTAALFGKINVYTVDDLIRHYPGGVCRQCAGHLWADHGHSQCEEGPESVDPERCADG